MSQTHALSGDWTRSPSWYEKVVLGLFKQMKKGRLTLTLPHGDRLVFGDPDFDVNPSIQASIRVLDQEFFKRCVLFGDIGFGEAYTDGLWETDNLTQVIRWMILNRETHPAMSGSKASNSVLGILRLLNRVQHLRRDNTLSGSRRNISAHYDLSNELFETFLDKTMTYSSGDYTTGAQSLEEAQLAKLDRIAHALELRPGEHLLEIGGGWGGLAVHSAKKYGCRVTSLTVSQKQLEVMKRRIEENSLQGLVEARLQDYREVQGVYDKIVSVEMIEAVGHRHLTSFFEVAERVLKPTGLMALQVITSADSRYDEIKRSVDWTQKHIFPGSLIPSIGALTDAARQKSTFQMHSLFDFGTSYARTLAAWREQFNSRLDRIRELGFDERFIRAWNYYFGYCEAAFAMRHISVAQVVYTRPNNLEILDQGAR
jgi:cyclopropane-fatty-acyl-phospholipid synthase